MRLAVIGPIPPFRSGIAEHTHLLASELEKRCHLLIVSYLRQYPAWLYPGQSERGDRRADLIHSRCHFVLDPFRPRTWRQTVDLIAKHEPEAVIIPWWTIYWAPCISVVARGLRRNGISVDFFCHNVLDHEKAAWKRAITSRVLRLGDGYFVQSPFERDRLLSLKTQGRITVHPHPVFNHYPAATLRQPRRAKLELLFFGLVRPYKGLDVLLRALAQIPDIDVRLTVAGEFWGGLKATRSLIASLGISDRVELIPRYVSEAEAASYFSRADVVVMPYRSATGSGVLGLAYHYGKPVVASRLPGIEELVLDGDTGILVEPDSADRLAGALRSMDSARASAMAPAIAAHAATLTWSSLADAVVGHVASRH